MYSDDDPRKKKKNPFDAFDDMFAQMGMDPDEFERMFRDVHKSLMEAMRSSGGMEPGKPFVSGFSFKMGPDGKPRFESFGNRPARGEGGLPRISDEREPLTDIIEDKAQIAVTLEIPGVNKKDIQIEAKSDSVEISVDTDTRKYHKIVRLPGKVKPETTKATYNNGVLDVLIQREDTGTGVRVAVE